ncbi:hypothetical protein VTL71DRAFT_14101 [Oculimacula yallundae]|uniref:Uncharacterized protein n=1 Tax=Oculimacula yallundae TaxID=86028 RepID=A0ABR4CIV6_9HELO
MAQESRILLLFASDLGTSTATFMGTLAEDSFDANGTLCRRALGPTFEMVYWPGGNGDSDDGDPFLPTELVYDRETRKLIAWGFDAAQFLKEVNQPMERYFVVRHIKLLLMDPDTATSQTALTARSRVMRERIDTVLGKTPWDVFQDFFNCMSGAAVDKILEALCHTIQPSRFELVIAFPPGWPPAVHQQVSALCTIGVDKVLQKNGFNIKNECFTNENVYAVSETLCGVNKWLQTVLNTKSRVRTQPMNLDLFNEGDVFAAADLGGGTGDLAIMMILSKDPPQIHQIGRTQSLELSGAAIEAEFRCLCKKMLSPEDYSGDLSTLIDNLCFQFVAEKKRCSSRPGSHQWHVFFPGLLQNPAKPGFCFRDQLVIERTLLTSTFAKPINQFKSVLQAMKENNKSIKAIVFLGQFGGTSHIFRKRMSESPIADLRLLYSSQGKMNVVRGALETRLDLKHNFVKKSETTKSYGSVLRLDWGWDGLEGNQRFPNAVRDGGLFESDVFGKYLVVIEWIIPSGTILSDQKYNVDAEATRTHFWEEKFEEEMDDVSEREEGSDNTIVVLAAKRKKRQTKKILVSEKKWAFEDTIIVSDEIPPANDKDGLCYALYTQEHIDNELYVDGEKKEVTKISLSWDLSRSEKLSPEGYHLGPYSYTDMQRRRLEKRSRKGRGPGGWTFTRHLQYSLVWYITEMELKIFVRAVFPNAEGPPSEQPGQQRDISGVSSFRSWGLERDIMLNQGIAESKISDAERHSSSRPHPDTDQLATGHQRAQFPCSSFLGAGEMIEQLARAHPHGRSKNHADSRENILEANPDAWIAGDKNVTQAPGFTDTPIFTSQSRNGTLGQNGRREDDVRDKETNELGPQGRSDDYRHDSHAREKERERRREIAFGKRKAMDVEREAADREIRRKNHERNRSDTLVNDDVEEQMHPDEVENLGSFALPRLLSRKVGRSDQPDSIIVQLRNDQESKKKIGLGKRRQGDSDDSGTGSGFDQNDRGGILANDDLRMDHVKIIQSRVKGKRSAIRGGRSGGLGRS